MGEVEGLTGAEPGPRRFAVVGAPVDHSSPVLHAAAYRAPLAPE